MEYDVERKAIEVQKKIFFDDFEVALKKKNKLNKFDILGSKRELVDNYIEEYLNENVQFKVNGKEHSINYLGHEYINGTITVSYTHLTLPTKRIV